MIDLPCINGDLFHGNQKLIGKDGKICYGDSHRKGAKRLEVQKVETKEKSGNTKCLWPDDDRNKGILWFLHSLGTSPNNAYVSSS